VVIASRFPDFEIPDQTLPQFVLDSAQRWGCSPDWSTSTSSEGPR
jgi:hypothetical protein